jgi:molybdate transport system substrate-binding protein
MTTMRMTITRTGSLTIGLVAAALLVQPHAARADEITVLCSNGIRAVMEELVPQFEKASKHHIKVTYGLAAALKRQIDAGEPFDVAVLTPQFIDDGIEKGVMAAGSRTVLARAGMAMAIRAGAPKPDIATTDALKRTLLASPAIAFAREGAAGTFFVALIDRLGIARDLQTKLKPVGSGVEVAATVARGDAAIGVLPLSEILPAPGVEVLGPFPRDVQSYLIMVAGVRRDSPRSSAAGELIRFLTSPAALGVLKAKGMERGQ